MPHFTIEIHADEVEQLLRQVAQELLLGQTPVPKKAPRDLAEPIPGLRVLNIKQLAERLCVSERHVPRLEARGRIPRRRRLGGRRVGYLLHEIEGRHPNPARVAEDRPLSLQATAWKLGLDLWTVLRLRDLSPPDENGRWSETAVDDWILSRPLARPRMNQFLPPRNL